MERYEKKYAVGNEKELKEGSTSIGKYEDEFKNYPPHEIIESLIVAMKSTGDAKVLSKRTWEMMFDLYDALEDELSEF